MSTFKRDIDDEGFKIVKCRWSKCKGEHCRHIKSLGEINAVSEEQARRDIEEIRQKMEARMQLEEKMEEEYRKEEN